MKRLISFQFGCIFNRDHIYIVAIEPSLEDENIEHSIVMRRSKGSWKHWSFSSRIVGIVCTEVEGERTFIAVSTDGQIYIADQHGSRVSHVDRAGDGPSTLRHLRGIRVIGESLFVFGMRRQIYKTGLKPLNWIRFDQGLFVPMDSKEIAGIWDLAGNNDRDLYTVGLEGEVWNRTKGKWKNIDVGTNLGIYTIKYQHNNSVYVAGDSGFVAHGSGNKWNHLTNNVTDAAFWCMAQLGDRIFLATEDEGLFEIVNEEVIKVPSPIKRQISTYWLHSNGDYLISIGNRDAFLFDSNKWTNLRVPRSI